MDPSNSGIDDSEFLKQLRQICTEEDANFFFNSKESISSNQHEGIDIVNEEEDDYDESPRKLGRQSRYTTHVSYNGGTVGTQFREDFSNIPPPKNSIAIKKEPPQTTDPTTVTENNFMQSQMVSDRDSCDSLTRMGDLRELGVLIPPNSCMNLNNKGEGKTSPVPVDIEA